MNYEELLKNAPDHLSEEFLYYLINNNVVVKFCGPWIIIENYKYHSKEHPWWTAFFKYPVLKPDSSDFKELVEFLPDGWCLMKKPSEKRTVKRLHYHLFPKP